MPNSCLTLLRRLILIASTWQWVALPVLSTPARLLLPDSVDSRFPAIIRREMGSSKRAGLGVVKTCTVPNTAALTFDDGPSENMEDILEMLQDADATGTFFFNGKNFKCIYDQENADRVRLAYESGHQIASHTWKHADLTALDEDEIGMEMWRIEEALFKITGAVPAFIRPPYGNFNDEVIEVAASRGQRLVTWDFDSQDSTGASAEESQALYLERIEQRPASILTLNHETKETTVNEVLPFAIENMRSAGYRLVSVAECLGVEPYQYVAAPAIRDESWTCQE